MNIAHGNIDTKLVNQTISSLIQQKFELYLIGSRTTFYYSQKSDYDYILIFQKSISLDELSKISIFLNAKLNENANQKTSVKIFDTNTFKEFIFQDYFRFYEYKLSNVNLTNDNDFFNSFDIPLTDDFLQRQMVNSIIIQYWWSIVTISNKSEVKETIVSKLFHRLDKNMYIYNSLAKEKLSINQIKNLVKQDSLYIQLDELGNNPNYSFFLKEYFERFRHEKINKFDYYIRTIETKLDIIINTKKLFKI